jgi:hypothetical protein
MTSPGSIDQPDWGVDATQERGVRRPVLAVVAGLRYTEQAQVFNRWLVPTYQTSFRWTGDWTDAEDATTWVFMAGPSRVRLPELVRVVDDRFADAAVEAVSRHWSERYGIAPQRCAAIHACNSTWSGSPLTLEQLFQGLSAEERLVLVLRFIRRRQLSAIAAQTRIAPRAAGFHLYIALSRVADRIGLDASAVEPTQTEQVAEFVDDLVGKRRPLRFEATPPAWAALVAATHVQAAIAGNNLPRVRFVRSLEKAFQAGRATWNVTDLRIWTA